MQMFMDYHQVINLGTLSGGLVYALLYLLSAKIRYAIGEQVPLGSIAMFLWGACIGLHAVCLFAPASFLKTSSSRHWMMEVFRTDSQAHLRAICVGTLPFLLVATYLMFVFAHVLYRV
jgi:hypothetical protein